MADPRLLIPLTAAASLMLLGCSTEPQVRVLDNICNPDLDEYYYGSTGSSNACTVSGDARETTGVSADTIGFKLGPGTGSLHIRMNAIQAVYSSVWSLDVLAASARPEGSTIFRTITWGSCASSCPADPDDTEAALAEDFEWITMVTGETGAVQFSDPIPDDALLTFTGADIDIVDIRLPGWDHDSYYYY